MWQLGWVGCRAPSPLPCSFKGWGQQGSCSRRETPVVPPALSSATRGPSVKKQQETGSFWAEILAWFGGITRLGAALARGTIQARARGRNHSLLRLGASGCSGTRDAQLMLKKREEGKASRDSNIALLNSNQMCSVCDLFCFARPSPVTSPDELFQTGRVGVRGGQAPPLPAVAQRGCCAG